MKKLLAGLLSLMLACLLLMPAAMAETEARKLPIDLTPGLKPDPNGYTDKRTYEDPTISVQVGEGVSITMNGMDDCKYWYARIKIADASQLRTMAAGDFYGNRVMTGTTLAKRANAVLAVNGDYFCYTGVGYILRQGEEYLNILKGDRDVLLIDEDGDFHPIYAPKAGEVSNTINGKKVINALYFGPVLVHEGKALQNVSGDHMAYDTGRQRMALCQVGPLEYLAVCCAGPARHNSGMTLQEFAHLCASLGAQTAYNLDGGDSTMLIFGGEKLNDVDNPSVRPIADIVYFASAWEAEQ